MTKHIVLTVRQVVLIILCTVYLQANVLADDVSSESQTQTYHPSYRNPQQLINSIQPLYKDQITLSTDGRIILLKGSGKILAEALELLPTLDHPPRQLLVELTNQAAVKNIASKHSSTKNYGTTRSDLPQRFTMLEGEPLTLLKQQQSQTVSASSPWWQEISTIPNRQAYLQLTATIVGEQVYLDIHQQTLHNDQLTVYENSMAGRINEWIHLQGPEPGSGSGETYRTGDRLQVMPAIKVSIIAP